ncbi:MAG: hypothetical protein LBL73_08030 [Synergistaceae bacterium]|jgi:hypothetical protein|nr:hypothetical protein [Synergistaceae bacterium]
MMSMFKRVLAAFIVVALLLCPSLVSASEIESAIEQSMRDTLIKAGIQGKTADGIARRYMFIGTVMLSTPRYVPAETASALLAQSEKTGTALGKALGTAYRVYGDKKLHDTASLMMRSVRAGLIAETASETFSVLAGNGYAFDAAVSVIQQASEFVRASSLPDRGVALCAQIRKLAAGREKIQVLQKEIVLASAREKEKQRVLMAQKEAEMREKGGRGGSGGDMIAAGAGRNQSGNPARGSSSSGAIASGGASSQGTSSSIGSGSNTGGEGSGSNAGSGKSGSNTGEGSGSNTDSANGDSNTGNDSSGSNAGGANSGSGAGNEGSGSNAGSGKGGTGGDGSGSNAGSSNEGSGSNAGGANGGSSAGNEGSGSNAGDGKGGSNAGSEGTGDSSNISD